MGCTHGHVAHVGVEGTGAYGAGLARHLRAAGVVVVEVDRPDRRTRRHKGKSDPVDALQEEIDDIDADLAPLVAAAAPGLLKVYGVGTEVAAQLLTTAGDNPDRLHCEAAFASLCGVAPLPASSGRTVRHRLNRGGDRHANYALHVIALVRLSWHEPTRAYAARRTAEGLSKPEIIRCLKRYIAREIYHALTS